jgi:ABC-type uncharacterized transport system auxiliary subunit
MNTFQQTLKFVVTFIASATIITGCGDNKASTTNDKTSTDTKQVATKTDNKIPELKPVDVYLNLEKQGFTTEKNFSSEYGNSWDCKSSSAGIDYHVNVFSDDVNSVERVRATAMLNGSEDKQIVATKPFLKYVASVPFEGNDPAKFAEWLDKNFNNDKQFLTISNVKFTIYAPTKLLRMLDIEKAK